SSALTTTAQRRAPGRRWVPSVTHERTKPVRRRSGALAPVLALAALMPCAQAVFAVPGHAGSAHNCPLSDPKVIAQYQQTQEIISGSANAGCPSPDRQTPGQFGPPNQVNSSG